MPDEFNDWSGESMTHSLSERVLLRLSRKPGSDDYRPEHVNYTPENALALLCRVFPDFMKTFVGREVLDFGCGTGHQAVTLSLNGARRVVGLDSSVEGLKVAKDLAARMQLTGKVEFIQNLDDRYVGKFDIVISKDSMEHFSDPGRVLDQMVRALNPDGMLFITFGPPWLAPYGGHMHFFTKLPWVHLLFSERTILTVRAHFRNDRALRYEDVEGGLNKMTVSRFERLVAQSGVRVLFRNDEYVKGISLPGKLPWIREFFINQVSCILTRKE